VNPAWRNIFARHYHHGAKPVGVNVAASDRSLMSNLGKGAFGDETMAAWKKFLIKK
jgi:hypothetical protein